MRFKQLFAIAASLTLLSSIIQPPAQAQSIDPPGSSQSNSSQPAGIPGWIWLNSFMKILLIMTVLMIGAAVKAQAQSNFKADQLQKAMYSGNGIEGSFENLSGTRWKESNNKGEINYFSETQRDEWSVYLKDESRSIRIQIDLYLKSIFVDPFGAGRRKIYSITSSTAKTINPVQSTDPRVVGILDWKFYLEKYPDVKEKFGNNAQAAQKHWLILGIAECRQSSSTFDIKYYLNSYPDLVQAFGTDCVKALNHWLTYGMKERRATVGISIKFTNKTDKLLEI